MGSWVELPTGSFYLLSWPVPVIFPPQSQATTSYGVRPAGLCGLGAPTGRQGRQRLHQAHALQRGSRRADLVAVAVCWGEGCPPPFLVVRRAGLLQLPTSPHQHVTSHPGGEWRKLSHLRGRSPSHGSGGCGCGLRTALFQAIVSLL